MNNFTGDHPYCVCQVKHAAAHGKTIQVQTKPVTTGDTLNPIWDERFEVEPVHQGDSLEFAVYDKGLVGSKTEGKAVLPSESFFPAGFNGMLPIEGLPGAMLKVVIQMLSGAPVAGMVAGEQQPVVLQAATPGLVSSTSIPQSTMAPPAVAMPSATTFAAAPVAMTYAAASPPVTSMPMMSCAAPPATTTAYSAPMTVAPAAAPATMMPYTYAQPQQPAAMTNFVSPIQTYSAAAPAVTYQQQPVTTYSAPTTARDAMQTTTMPTMQYATQQPVQQVAHASQPLTSGASFVAYPVAMPMGPCKLSVTIVRAQGLHHLNHFTGDHPYVVCEVKHHERHFGRSTKVQTQPVKEGDTLNPFWNETLDLEPWHQGEPLEFTVYDKGLMGSKTEGKAILKAESFFPNGFNGLIPVAGLPQAMVHVCVRVMGPSQVDTSSPMAALTPTIATVSPTTGVTTVEAKKRKKMKKKSKGCC
jgi:hypothetical protein